MSEVNWTVLFAVGVIATICFLIAFFMNSVGEGHKSISFDTRVNYGPTNAYGTFPAPTPERSRDTDPWIWP
jgi:hypothetical protein